MRAPATIGGAATTTDTLLIEIRDRLSRIETLLERRNRRPDDRWDDALVLAIAASTDGHHFSPRELFRHATTDGALKRALDDACIENPRQCGKWLRRREGHPVADIVIERVDLDHRDGILWRARVSRV